MNTRRVQAAAGVILAAQKTRKTAAGIAIALESAQLLQSPESAAEVAALRDRVASLTESLRDAAGQVAALESELGGAAARVAELETLSETTKRIMADAAAQVGLAGDRIAELETRLGRDAEQRHLMDPLDHTLEALAPRTTDVRPQVQQLRDLLAGQRAAVETPLPHPTDAGSAL